MITPFWHQSSVFRLLCIAFGLVVLAAGIAAQGLVGLLLVMGALVPIGAAIANAAVISSTREALGESPRHQSSSIE
jgi:hypothetical protein